MFTCLLFLRYLFYIVMGFRYYIQCLADLSTTRKYTISKSFSFFLRSIHSVRFHQRKWNPIFSTNMLHEKCINAKKFIENKLLSLPKFTILGQILRHLLSLHRKIQCNLFQIQRLKSSQNHLENIAVNSSKTSFYFEV